LFEWRSTERFPRRHLHPCGKAISVPAAIPCRHSVTPMNTDEIIKRLRIGLALVVGYLTGKGLGQIMGHHPSEFFVVGFGLGVILTHAAYWGLDRWVSRHPR
jgi:hypothetical protein